MADEIHPADALADVRAAIKVLQQQEALLRAQILTREEGARIGARYMCQVSRREETRFSAALLPQDIREDPRYARLKHATYVKCLPVAPVAAPPRRAHAGWQKRDEAQVLMAREPESEFNVIESF